MVSLLERNIEQILLSSLYRTEFKRDDSYQLQMEKVSFSKKWDLDLDFPPLKITDYLVYQRSKVEH